MSVSWGYCDKTGAVTLNGSLVAEYHEEGYVLLFRSGRSWRVVRLLGQQTTFVTLTCDDNGCVLCASAGVGENFLNATLDRRTSGTYSVKVPTNIGYLERETIVVPDKDIESEISLSYGDTPLLTHYTLYNATTMVGYGGLCRKLETYRQVRVGDIHLVESSGRITTFSDSEEAITIAGVYNGSRIYLPDTDIEVIMFDMEQGDRYQFEVPKSLLSLTRSAVYYPYGPMGERYWMKEKPTSANTETQQPTNEEKHPLQKGTSILAIGEVKWGKVTVHGIDLDPTDTNYYRGSGRALVMIQVGIENRILNVIPDVGEELRPEYAYPTGHVLVIERWGMRVYGEYPEGEYIVHTPVYNSTEDFQRHMYFWPWLPDGSSLLYCTTQQMDLSEAVENGQMLGKLEAEFRGIIQSSSEPEYLELINSILRDAPGSATESERPLWTALSWVLAERKGRL